MQITMVVVGLGLVMTTQSVTVRSAKYIWTEKKVIVKSNLNTWKLCYYHHIVGITMPQNLGV